MVEAEAMPAAAMRSLLRQAIERFTDPHELVRVEAITEAHSFIHGLTARAAETWR
jgi:hypothetical protein